MRGGLEHVERPEPSAWYRMNRRIVGRLRGECRNRERSDTLPEAQVLIEHWRAPYNHGHPHPALGDRYSRAASPIACAEVAESVLS